MIVTTSKGFIARTNPGSGSKAVHAGSVDSARKRQASIPAVLQVFKEGEGPEFDRVIRIIDKSSVRDKTFYLTLSDEQAHRLALALQLDSAPIFEDATDEFHLRQWALEHPEDAAPPVDHSHPEWCVVDGCVIDHDKVRG